MFLNAKRVKHYIRNRGKQCSKEFLNDLETHVQERMDCIIKNAGPKKRLSARDIWPGVNQVQ